MAKKSRKAKDELNDFEDSKVEDEAFSESYLSMGLGLLVVLVVGVLLFNFFTRDKNQSDADNQSEEETSEETENVAPTKEETGNYTVVEGDTLWSIAEDTYESGFEWERIAQENNLANPDALEAGQALTLPSMGESVLPETGIESGTHTVQANDTLWGISCQVYGNCYRWQEIAEANSLSSPDTIETGTVLSIPR